MMDEESFVSTFRKVLQTVADTGKLRDEIAGLRDQLNKMNLGMLRSASDIEDLIQKTELQNLRIGEITRSSAAIEGSMLAQIQDASKQMHEEILIQRNTNRVDLNTMKQNLGKSLNDAISKLAIVRGTSPGYGKGIEGVETPESVLKRLAEIEQTLNIQSDINNHLNDVIQNDSRLEHVYHSMLDRMVNMEKEMNATRMENTRLALINESVFGSLQELSSMVKKHEEYFHAMVDNKIPRLPELPAEPSNESLRLTDTMSYLSAFDHVTDIPTYPEFPAPITVKPILPEIQEAIINSRANSARRKRGLNGSRPGTSDRASGTPAPISEGGEAASVPILDDEIIETEVMLNLRERHGSPEVPGVIKTRVLSASTPRSGSESGSRPQSSSRSHVHSAVYPPPLEEQAARAQVAVGSSGTHGRQTIVPSLQKGGGSSSASALQQSYQSGYQVGYNTGFEAGLSSHVGKFSFNHNAPSGEDLMDGDAHPEGRRVTIVRKPERSKRPTIREAPMESEDQSQEPEVPTTNEEGDEEGEGNSGQVTRDEYNDLLAKIGKLTDTQKQFQTASKHSFKSIAAVVEELKSEVHALKARPVNAGRKDTIIKHGNISKEVEDPEVALEDKLMALKALWMQLHADLCFGLDFLSDRPVGGDSGMLVEVTKFMAQVEDFVKHLEFGAGHSASELLTEIHPILDELTLKALHMLRLDEAAQNSAKVTLCLSDILCENEEPKLRNRIIECLDGSVEALDSKLNKIDLRRRLDNLELFVSTRAAESMVEEMNQNLRSMIAAKADMVVVEEITATKASIKELRRLKDRMINQMDGASFEDSSVEGETTAALKEKARQASAEVVEEMNTKFEILYKQFQDLRQFTDQYVPRDEVQEAMRAVIHEVKSLRANAVTNNVFNDALKHKADGEDVQKLIKSLTEAMGNVEGRASSSIVHTKCLVCDAPVNSMTPGPRDSKSPPHARGIGYDKRADSSQSRPQSTSLLSSRSLSSALGRERNNIKVSSDVRIVRNSVDLPPIDPARDESGNITGSQQAVISVILNGRQTSQSNLNDDIGGDDDASAGNSKISKQAFKERLRASAGGGMGPSYKSNTR